MKELIKFTVKDGETDLEFSFVEPSKAVLREGEVVNSVTLANCLRDGYMSAQEAAKIHTERGGIFTKDENEDYQKSMEEYILSEKQLKDAEIKDEVLVEKVSLLKNRVLSYYNRQDNIFEHTAERKARDVTMWHYALSLVYKDGKPYFEGSNYKERQKKFDDTASEIKEEVYKRGIWYATAYISGLKLEDTPYPISKTPVQ